MKKKNPLNVFLRRGGFARIFFSSFRTNCSGARMKKKLKLKMDHSSIPYIKIFGNLIYNFQKVLVSYLYIKFNIPIV